MKIRNIFSCRRYLLFCLVTIVLAAYNLSLVPFIYAQNVTNDFPMYRYTIQRTGRVPFAGPANNSVKWSISTSGEIWSSPAVSTNGTIYVGSTDGNLLSITPKGKVV